MIKDLYTGSIGSSPSGFTEVNGTVFFSADVTVTTGQGHHSTTTSYGRELWKTDGTAAGTVMVKDINTGFNGSSPSEMSNLNGTLLFKAYTDLGWELWRSDGTSAGTVLVQDINPSFRSSDPRGLRTHNGLMFFNAIQDYEQNLWQSDGTASGTRVATDFAPGFTGFVIPSTFMDIGGSVVFAAVGQSLGFELWRTDHTAAGTFRLQQLIPPETFQVNPYRVSSQAQAGSRTFFTAIDPQVQMELHVTDGTLAGTRLLRDIFPGNGNFDPFPDNLTDVNGRLFFVADDGVHGRELWISDGTTAGTRRVSDPPTLPQKAVTKLPTPTSVDRVGFSTERIPAVNTNADDLEELLD
jgi:ELWxxDGT repeat protein